MENSFADPIWFLWPVAFAVLAGFPRGPGQRGARRPVGGSGPGASGFVELIASAVTLADYCGEGENTSRLAHLAVAGLVLLLSAGAGAGGPKVDD